MRTLLSWTLSFALHMGVLAILFSVAEDRMQLQPILTLDLTPKKSRPLSLEKAKPLPPLSTTRALDPHKTETKGNPQILKGPQQVQASPLEKTAAPSVQEKVISSSTRPVLADESGDGVRHIRMDAVAHRGAEARFGRMLLADYYSYSPNEFAGQFMVGKERTVTIIDARQTSYGRFLLYDSQLGTLRRLKKFNKYIYTIGPSLDKDEPVTGSVTFLAKDDRIERFIYLPDGEKGLFPSKVHFREEPVRIASDSGNIEALVTLPPTKGAFPAMVLVHGREPLPPALVQGAVRSLGMQGIALMAFSARGCKEEGAPFCFANAAALALAQLKGHREVQNQPVGFLGIGAGCSDAIHAVYAANNSADYLVCLPGKTGGTLVMPDISTLSQVTIPSLWIVPDSPPWKAFRGELERLRDQQGLPLTIVAEAEKPVQRPTVGNKKCAGATILMQVVLDNHSPRISAWLAALKKTLIAE